MANYKEVSSKNQLRNKKVYKEGEVIRTVWLSERDANILNEETKESGIKYEKIVGIDRKPLFMEAKELGLKPAKNIETADLIKLIEEAKNVN